MWDLPDSAALRLAHVSTPGDCAAGKVSCRGQDRLRERGGGAALATGRLQGVVTPFTAYGDRSVRAMHKRSGPQHHGTPAPPPPPSPHTHTWMRYLMQSQQTPAPLNEVNKCGLKNRRAGEKGMRGRTKRRGRRPRSGGRSAPTVCCTPCRGSLGAFLLKCWQRIRAGEHDSQPYAYKLSSHSSSAYGQQHRNALHEGVT